MQRGSLKIFNRKAGPTWVLRYRVSSPDGRKVEHGSAVGLVRDFPKERDAWKEVHRLGLFLRINDDKAEVRIRFDALAEHYLKVEHGPDAVRPKSTNTIPIVEHYVRDYLVARWGNQLAEGIGPLEVQKWLVSLHNNNGLAWTTVSKIAGLMKRIYRIGLIHEKVTRNPVEHVETRSTSNYRAITISPAQTLAILGKMDNPLHYALVLTCAATALRASELISLRWSDVLWLEDRIRVSKRWAKGQDGATKTKTSDGFVPMHPVLAEELKQWRSLSPYIKPTDFVFPSFRADGKVPLSTGIFVADHLRKAAIEAGVSIEPGQRWGLHNLRHSISSWLVNKAHVQAKTVQTLLRHANVKTTLNLYTHEDSEETRTAQGAFLHAVGVGSQLVQ